LRWTERRLKLHRSRSRTLPPTRFNDLAVAAALREATKEERVSPRFNVVMSILSLSAEIYRQLDRGVIEEAPLVPPPVRYSDVWLET
jgi:hypothetical protein